MRRKLLKIFIITLIVHVLIWFIIVNFDGTFNFKCNDDGYFKLATLDYIPITIFILPKIINNLLGVDLESNLAFSYHSLIWGSICWGLLISLIGYIKIKFLDKNAE